MPRVCWVAVTELISKFESLTQYSGPLGRHQPSIGISVYRPQQDKRSPNTSLLLAHRLQPWLSCKTALAKGLIFAGDTGNSIP